MKKLVVAIAVGMVAVGAFAQGKVALSNGSRLIYFADSKLGVTAVDNIKAELWVGTSVDALIFAGASTGWNAATPGLMVNANIVLPNGFPGGGAPGAAGDAFTYFFQVRAFGGGAFANASFAEEAFNAMIAGTAYGESPVFTARASSTAAYFNIASTASPAYSTWAAGTETIGNATQLGALAINVVPVPEPSSMLLAGLGAAALLIFRRRN